MFKTYIELYQKNKTLIAFIVGALFILFFLKQCNQISTLKEDIKIANENTQREINNANATKDSVRIISDSNGNLISTIKSYEFDINNLREDQRLLTNKYKKALDLNKKLENVNFLLMADLEIKDSLIARLSVTQIDQNSAEINFVNESDWGNGNYRKIGGSLIVSHDSDGIIRGTDPKISFEQRIRLLAAVEENAGVQSLKITTDYPGLTFTDIENINLINNKLNQKASKKAGWSLGLGVGYGVMLTPGQTLVAGPTVGANLIWSPKWLRF